MYSFVNDYSHLCHKKILEKISECLSQAEPGYGYDRHCAVAKDRINQACAGLAGDIHFIPGGTQVNLVALSAFLRPHQAALAATTAHIHDHEAGAIESRGHKIHLIATGDGKLSPALLDPVVQAHQAENTAQAKLVYISDTTELGGVYRKKELEALSQYCRDRGLILYLDGARLGSALTARDNDLTLPDLARLCDAFFIGGTKNGALLGEALLIQKESLKEDFRPIMKQNGAILAKSFLMGLQFEVLFEDRLFFDLAAHANHMAMRLAEGMEKKGVRFLQPPQSNQLFPILRKEEIQRLRKDFLFEDWKEEGEDLASVRFVTSFMTQEEEVDALIAALS